MCQIYVAQSELLVDSEIEQKMNEEGMDEASKVSMRQTSMQDRHNQFPQ